MPDIDLYFERVNKAVDRLGDELVLQRKEQLAQAKEIAAMRVWLLVGAAIVSAAVSFAKDFLPGG